MSMILYGSQASPYVRRIRMLLENSSYHFEQVDVYTDDKRAEFAKISPIKKLPVLVDNGKTIFDSHVICQYLLQQPGRHGISSELSPVIPIEQHNIISAIDAAIDSLIILLQTKRSGLEIDPERLICRLQLERVPDCLHWLNQQADNGAFDEWHFPTIALISALGWITFRDLYDTGAYTALIAAAEKFSERDIVKITAPQ